MVHSQNPVLIMYCLVCRHPPLIYRYIFGLFWGSDSPIWLVFGSFRPNFGQKVMVLAVFGSFRPSFGLQTGLEGHIGGVWGLKSALFQVLAILGSNLWVYLGFFRYSPPQTPPSPPSPPGPPKPASTASHPPSNPPPSYSSSPARHSRGGIHI